MQRTLILVSALLAHAIYAAEPLKSKELVPSGPGRFDSGAVFSYQAGTLSESGLTRGGLPNSHPLYTDEFGAEDMILGIFDVSGQGHLYYAVFSLGPSWDLNYCLYEKARVDTAMAGKLNFLQRCDWAVYAPNLTIAGNGLLYTSGHNNNLTDEKRAFRFTDGKFNEIPQPLHYANQATVSKRQQQVFADEALTQSSFRLEENEAVTLIAVKSAPHYQHRFLLVNSHGLTGWVLADMNQDDTQFKCVFFPRRLICIVDSA